MEMIGVGARALVFVFLATLGQPVFAAAAEHAPLAPIAAALPAGGATAVDQDPSPLHPVAPPIFRGAVRPRLNEVPAASLARPDGSRVKDRAAYRAAKLDPTAPAGVASVDPMTADRLSVRSGTGFEALTTINTGFDGSDFSTNFATPPDVGVAVGPNQVVETVNLRMTVYSAAGAVIGSTSFTTFFAGLNTGFFMSDPRLVYDAPSGRWFLTLVGANTVTNTGALWIAASTTSDATGLWNQWRYSYSGSAPDFPGLGTSNDKIAIATNAFTLSGGTFGSFSGAQFLILRKSDLAAGLPIPTAIGSPLITTAFGIQPAQSMTSTAVLFMTSQDTTTSGSLWSVSGEPGVSTVSFVRTAVSIGATIAPYAPQQGAATLLDTGDERVLRAVWQNGKLWASSNSGCLLTGDTAVRACLHVFGLDTTSLTVANEWRLGSPGSYYYYPTVQPDGAGNLFVVFGRSSSNAYPEVRVTMQLATDAGPGPSSVLKAGNNAYVCSICGSVSRFGDFFGAAVDPTNTQRVWLAGEYGKATILPACGGCTVLDNWGTFVAQVMAPVVVPPAVTGLSPSSGPASGGTSVTISGSGFSVSAGATIVRFGTGAATGVSCISSTSCTATSPAGAGVVDVTATVAGLTSAIAPAGRFTYGVGTGTYEDASPSLVIGGTWATWPDPQHSGGTAAYSHQTGASVRLTYTGSAITLVYSKWSVTGIATVMIDGAVVDSLDTYSAALLYQQQQTYRTAAGTHSVTVTVSGTKNAASADTYVVIDAFVVRSAVDVGTYEDSSASLVVGGTWATWPDAQHSGGSAVYSNLTGANVGLTFTGSAVTLVYAKLSVTGIATVAIDGAVVDSLDTYDPGLLYQQLKTYTTAPGTHTVTVTVSGAKNPASGATYLVIDALAVRSAVSAGTYENTSPALVIGGSWATWPDAQHSGGTAVYSHLAGATIGLTFTGTAVTLVYAKLSVTGIATVAIDGVVIDSLDAYTAGLLYQQQRTYPTTLGTHTVTVTVSGTKNPASGETYLVVDALTVTG